jgi:hypothetical protein
MADRGGSHGQTLEKRHPEETLETTLEEQRIGRATALA